MLDPNPVLQRKGKSFPDVFPTGMQFWGFKNAHHGSKFFRKEGAEFRTLFVGRRNQHNTKLSVQNRHQFSQKVLL